VGCGAGSSDYPISDELDAAAKRGNSIRGEIHFPNGVKVRLLPLRSLPTPQPTEDGLKKSSIEKCGSITMRLTDLPIRKERPFSEFPQIPHHLIRFLFENLSLLSKYPRSHHSPRLIKPDEARNERTYSRADH
jgi:hypothetical protein